MRKSNKKTLEILWGLTALAMVALIGILDHFTGKEISFQAFYLLAILIAGMKAGGTWGLLMAMASTCAYFASNVVFLNEELTLQIHLWNTAMRLVVFVTIAVLIRRWKHLPDLLEKQVEKRTSQLADETARSQKNEVKYRNLTESLDELVYRADPETFVATYVNKAVEKIYGYTVEEFLSVPTLWESAIHPEDKERVLAWFAEIQRRMESDAIEYRIIKKDKTVRWVEDCASWEKDQQGNIVSLNGTLHDITERKQAEEERKSLTEQLVRSEKLAAVGELISGVAHEIKNPLTGMLGLSDLLLRKSKENFNEETKICLRSIHESSMRIEKIVANLLRFARREAPARKNVVVNEVIDTVLDIRSYEMKVRNVELKKNYQPDLPLIMADPSQLEQVFLNIINNAEYAIHKTGKAGTLTIATSLQEEQPEDKKVIIEISDTGAGIPENVFSKLFNPFFTTKPIGKGTGLGLSVSYGIIKEHGGEIHARNRKEGGAVFTIELPISGGGRK